MILHFLSALSQTAPYVENSESVCQPRLSSGRWVHAERAVPPLRVSLPVAQARLSRAVHHREHVVNVDSRRPIQSAEVSTSNR